MLTPNGRKERENIKEIIGDLVVACLWHPEMTEAHGETANHILRAWREGGIVKAEVKSK